MSEAPAIMNLIATPITDVRQANELLAHLYTLAANKAAHVARGRSRISSIIPGFALVVHEVWPVTEGQDNDITDMGGKGKMYRSTFMRTLAQTAGLRVKHSVRIDDGRHPHLAAFEVVLSGQDLAMRPRQWVGNYELDLRDGSSRLEGLAGEELAAAAKRKGGGGLKMMIEKRNHIVSLAETGAFCRAVVDALSIQRGFRNIQPLALPIYIPTIELHTEPAPDEMRQAMGMAALGAMMGWGPPAQPAALPTQRQNLPAPAPTAPAAAGSGLQNDIIDEDGFPVDDEPDDGDHPFEDEPDDSDEEPEAPADDTPPDDPPAGGPPDDPQITNAQKEELKELGCWRKGCFFDLGWKEGQPVTESMYVALKKKYGGA